MKTQKIYFRKSSSFGRSNLHRAMGNPPPFFRGAAYLHGAANKIVQVERRKQVPLALCRDAAYLHNVTLSP
ncbi:MAG: hypothetical protein K2H70_00445, partial [Bacteroidales bacterium]|nr:hypothetical protein [Bacteroidales bacterium]